MLWLVLLLGTGVVAGKLAETEDRSPWPWGAGAVAATWGLGRVLGMWYLVAPVVVLAAAFVALWILRSRDDRDRGSGIVR